MKINQNDLADELARLEGKKTSSLNAAQAREAVRIVKEQLRRHTDVEVLEWLRRR